MRLQFYNKQQTPCVSFFFGRLEWPALNLIEQWSKCFVKVMQLQYVSVCVVKFQTLIIKLLKETSRNLSTSFSMYNVSVSTTPVLVISPLRYRGKSCTFNKLLRIVYFLNWYKVARMFKTYLQGYIAQKIGYFVDWMLQARSWQSQ